ncbi:MAG: S49 family peptidase, partial [Planctomycetes bacterium]|nr:S49 family peptidase [Planctomycetota bacterium]
MRPSTLLTPFVLLLAIPAQEAGIDSGAPTSAAASAAAADDVLRVPFLAIEGVYQDLPELGFDPVALLAGGGGPKPKPFFDLIATIDRLAEGAATEVLLDLSGGVGLNLAQLREVERAMGRLSAAGKRVTCYLESAGTAAYQIASQCDHVMMADMGTLDLRSPAMQVMHLKDALDLLGVEVEVTRVGAYKGAVEPYMRSSISDHLRRHYEAMLESMNGDVVRRIARGRRIPESAVRDAQRQRLFTAPE